jgi:hypothetical protein
MSTPAMTFSPPQLSALYAMRQIGPITVQAAEPVEDAQPQSILARALDGRTWAIGPRGTCTRMPDLRGAAAHTPTNPKEQ